MLKKLFTLLLLIWISETSAQSLFVQEGMASYYADKFEGKPTASGEKYKHDRLTAAHKTLPFGTIIRVTNLANNKTVEVKVNDRGPFVEGRIVDLSKLAATRLDFVNKGLAKVKLEVVKNPGGKESAYDPGKPNMTDPNVEEKEFYEFSVNRLTPTGFGVQIGTYQELANLVRLSDNLQKSYRKKVTVQVSILNGTKVYRIIIGRESTRKKAEALKQKLKKKYPDCFVVEFRNL